MILSDTHIQQLLLSQKHQSKEGEYYDFSDGTVTKDHPVIAEHPNALKIVGYYDELEICNPLGSSVKKHKLGLVFFTIANFHPKHRSNYKGIFLTTVANYTLIEEHGIDVILQPFVEDLKVLASDGIAINSPAGEVQIHGALISFLADNLASHSVGGFKESMSFARHFCRTCMAEKETAISFFFEENFTLRTPHEHQKQCHNLEKDPSLSVQYGINRNSILNTIPGFSVVTGLPQDFMHDLLEGVVNYELRLLLRHCCVSCKYFTINQLNDRIKSFNYGYTETSTKPPELSRRCITEEMKIRFSASEMLTMARIFPLLIGDKIPESDQNYQCFLLLIKILRISLAPTITNSLIAYLRIIIEEHHQLFRDIYNNESFIPKLHYMVHYPRQILRHGPLIRSWTMRHEGKLNFFKQVSKNCNFKNITLSLAKRHQLWLSYHLQTQSFIENEIIRGPIASCNQLCNEDETISILIKKKTKVYDHSLITHLRWVKINGLKYMPNNAFLITSVADTEPTFSKVQEIIAVDESKFYLLTLTYKIILYTEHTLSYSILPTCNIEIIDPTELKYPVVLHSITSSNIEHICLPFYVC